ncbi:hypothetical protein [Dyadobacter sandarakinus]|uniref:Beta-lactamase-inhibitor-like, PepSY-like n=1 Tax=Dyadobacter sandarakinus TaxID=2747268 RepID=A0ABX7IDA7_9BACT|nr:hypothetical protein [Dyadobacter sandarakinus]QRR03688.1 hypothetical protein HWI92_23610 [Dyadobacter sandarakinus]
MRKISLLLIVMAAIWFGACQNNNEAVPDNVEEAAGLDMVAASAARYSVANDSVTAGKCRGKLTEVAPDSLPASVTSYITSTYPGASITFAAQDQSGKTVVAITLADGSVKGLLFGTDGLFSQELAHHKHKAQLTRVDSAALPAAITGYITTHYAGASIRVAATNAAGEYFVAATLNGTEKVLLFNADGTFNKELDKPAKRRKKH